MTESENTENIFISSIRRAVIENLNDNPDIIDRTVDRINNLLALLFKNNLDTKDLKEYIEGE
jgi:hypothetical protein